MKFVHITYHFEYTDQIERLLDRHAITQFVRYSMVEGMDSDGKHFGSQVFPGNSSVVQAQVPEDRLEALLEDLARFRDQKIAHRHLQALVLPIERTL